MASSVESGGFRHTEVAEFSARQCPGVDLQKGILTQETEATPGTRQRETHYMTRVSRGDRQAFGMLHQNYVRCVAAFFRRHPPCSETADELTQEVFFRVWEKREEYRPGTPDLPYLLGFARTIQKKAQGKNHPNHGTRADHLLDSTIDLRQASPYHQVEHQEWTQILRSLMDRLPEKQRRALELTYFKGLSTPEAAELVGCSAKTIRRNRQMGMVKMQAWLKAGE